MAELSRRGLLTGSWRSNAAAFRPPWSGDEQHFLIECIRCDACVPVCETRILRRGRGGYPEIDFSKGECTFCYACADACPQPLFHQRETSPWEYTLFVNDSCLAFSGVECRSCQDFCEMQAINFHPSAQGVSLPRLNRAACNACGGCIAGCPVSALTMRHADAS
ncbi:ferredoxin-type protein NapF [Enterobacteriaceae bacterium H20N1]|uniref:Ferredoxin-type protein NapF n=1 Tax=Dryocola boscaweniae TaxID=2925397 RepID=A0A9X2W6C5_9ENTR|nr:ferredoxin-type protein NapF [Dryocola boscaweniae]MCT4701431.1 ferredoxin-type protein NapF [Dryocola boscaweniae]MCT4718658.1 ferredoxin-type protein NapF [Dryocola boscaweniae]